MNRKRYAVNSVLLLLIFTIFAVSSLFLVIIGANAYRGVVRDSGENDQVRSSLSYVVNKVRASDGAGLIKLGKLGGTDVLQLLDGPGDGAYCTYLYHYDGEIRELYQEADSQFQPEKGLLVSKLDRFSMRQEGNLLSVTAGGEGQRTLSAQVCLRSMPTGQEV